MTTTAPLASFDETLDPADWEAYRRLGYQMVDDMLEYLSSLRDRPVWQPMPEHVRASFAEPAPRVGIGAEAAYAEFVKRVLPYPNGNLHPRFWGWVQGTGTPLAMFAEMLAAGMNPHMAGFNQAPALVEHQVLAWLAELLGMPVGTSGLLVSTGSMANILGLAVARHAKAGFDVREKGLHGGPALMVYGSTETHGWAQKANELLGLGNRAFRRIRVGDDYRVDVAEMAATIRADRAAGARPICIIGTAGTVNTGATDDLEALAALARAEGLWFHVDGAFGALTALSEQLRHIVAGLAQADSIGFDLHKWMYMPFEAACLLVRDATMHRAAFALSAAYLTETSRGVIAGGLPFADRGVDLSRNFKALKIWLSLKGHGVAAFVRLLEQNVAQARYLAERITAAADLELVAPVSLNVVCFRYVAEHVDGAVLNRLNQELLLRLQERGLAVPSGTTLRGQYALRCAIVNHRSRREDFDMLVAAVQHLGAELLAE